MQPEKHLEENVSDFISRAMTVFRDDIQAVKDRDPAATNTLEIILSYPGLHAIWMHRVAHYLHTRNVPLIPRLISMLARAVTGLSLISYTHLTLPTIYSV